MDGSAIVVIILLLFIIILFIIWAIIGGFSGIGIIDGILLVLSILVTIILLIFFIAYVFSKNKDNNLPNNNNSSQTTNNTFQTSITSYVIKRSVEFDSNGGGGSMSAYMVNDGDTFTLPTCTFISPNGKKFKAWAVVTDTELIAMPGRNIIVRGNVIIKAIWENDSTKQSIDLEYKPKKTKQ